VYVPYILFERHDVRLRGWVLGAETGALIRPKIQATDIRTRCPSHSRRQSPTTFTASIDVLSRQAILARRSIMNNLPHKGESLGAITPEDESNERFSIRSLIRRVEEFNCTQELSITEGLVNENELLQHQITYYEKVWQSNMDLLHRCFKSIMQIKRGLEKVDREEKRAEQAWLAYWSADKAMLKQEPWSWI